ncbi:MAG: hypothetical protein HRT45_03650 [Bdellovibrionales bacterium]|nr:hypothetical protein [Bdellovibrionales bacterium]
MFQKSETELEARYNKRLKSAYRKVLKSTGSLFRVNLNQLNWDGYQFREPLDKLPSYKIQIDGLEIRLSTARTHVISTHALDFMSLASQFWAIHYERQTTHLINATIGWEPNIDVMVQMALHQSRKELIEIAEILHQKKKTALAKSLMFLMLRPAFTRLKDFDFDKASLTVRAMPLKKAATADIHNHQISASTYLAGCKKIFKGGGLNSKDPVVKLQNLRLLHRLVGSCGKVYAVLKTFSAELIEQSKREKNPIIKEAYLTVLEQMMIKAYLGFEMNLDRFKYPSVIPVLQYLLSEGVNVELNKARLVEALWGTGEEKGADDLKAELLDFVGDEWHTPPMWLNRHAYSNYRLWLMSARIRVSYHKSTMAEFTRHVESCRKHYQSLKKHLKQRLPERDFSADFKLIEYDLKVAEEATIK